MSTRLDRPNRSEGEREEMWRSLEIVESRTVYWRTCDRLLRNVKPEVALDTTATLWRIRLRMNEQSRKTVEEVEENSRGKQSRKTVEWKSRGMMKSVRDIYTRYVGGAYLAHPDLSISQKNNVVNDRNCGFVFAPKTFDTVVALSNFLVCVLGLCRFSFVLYHFSLFLFYSCPVFLLVHSISRSFYLSFSLPLIRVILSSRSHCQSNTRKVAINESIKW